MPDPPEKLSDTVLGLLRFLRTCVTAKSGTVLELLVFGISTYASSEYLHGSRLRAFWAAIAAGAAVGASRLTPALSLQHRLPLVYIFFLGALYVDIVSCAGQLRPVEFVVEVLDATVRVLPLFPLFVIGFVFLFAPTRIGQSSRAERLSKRLGHDGLDEPICYGVLYGVLYGPFTYVYVLVKAVAKVSTQHRVAAPGLSWARLALTVVCVPIAGLVLFVACDMRGKISSERAREGRVTTVGEKAAAVIAAVVTVAAAALVAARAV
jgi:hypothetical protein